MRLVPPFGIQCPTCGSPVQILESLHLTEDDHVLVRSEPCLHEWEFSA